MHKIQACQSRSQNRSQNTDHVTPHELRLTLI